MPIAFNSIPGGILEPFIAVEFDSSHAESGPAIQPYKGLIVGQRLASGTAPLLATTTDKRLITSYEQASADFGTGSVAARMCKAWLNQNRVTELWAIGVADAGGATAWTQLLTVTVTTALAGTLYLHICGELVAVGVVANVTQNNLAIAIAAAVNAFVGLPVTASATTNVVTFTARNLGTCGNSIDIRLNYLAGETTPGGVTIVMAAPTLGATDPTIVDTLAVIGDTWFNRIVSGWRNTSVENAWAAEMDARFGPLRPIDGRVFFGAFDTHANLVTLTNAKNSKHLLHWGVYKPASNEWEYAAATAGATALSAQEDPARPHQTIPLAGIYGPAAIDEFDFSERNILVDNGCATTHVESGVVRIGRSVTNYQRSQTGADDSSYRDLTTLDTLSYLRYSLRQRLATKFPRSKLADDGTRFGAGQAIVTPSSARGEILAWFRELEARGIVEGFDQFKRDLVVERNASDPSRLDILVPSNLINGLIVMAAQIQFRL